jgi:AcrR family transcriptional regulator
VGQQQLIEECGCGKNLLYREFASKDELVVAYLDRKARESDAIVEAAMAPYAGDPAAQMLAIVRSVAAQVGSPGYRGCPFLNVHAEFPDPDHPVNRAAVAHRRANLERFRDLAEQAGASNPAVLADRIMLIVDGMYANGATQGGEATMAAAVASRKRWSGRRRRGWPDVNLGAPPPSSFRAEPRNPGALWAPIRLPARNGERFLDRLGMTMGVSALTS